MAATTPEQPEEEEDTLVRLLSHDQHVPNGQRQFLPRPAAVHSTTMSFEQPQITVYLTRPDALPPFQAYRQSAGWDLAVCEQVLLAPGERAVCPTGLYFDMKVDLFHYISMDHLRCKYYCSRRESKMRFTDGSRRVLASRETLGCISSAAA